MTDITPLAHDFITLLLVVEPFGLAPIFLAATLGQDTASRAAIAARASLYAFLVLAGAALGGEALLRALGVSLPAFRIAGGLLLFSIASEMALGVRARREADSAVRALGDNARHLAAYPLAIPLMAGPGAITATVLLSGAARGDPLRLGGLLLSIAMVMLISYAACRLAVRAERLLGAAANIMLAKLLGVLLAALAVQFVVDGARALF